MLREREILVISLEPLGQFKTLTNNGLCFFILRIKWLPKHCSLQLLNRDCLVHQASKFTIAPDAVPLSCEDGRAMCKLDDLQQKKIFLHIYYSYTYSFCLTKFIFIKDIKHTYTNRHHDEALLRSNKF